MKLKQVLRLINSWFWCFYHVPIIENKSKSSDSKGKSDKKKSNE
jgi:hypothetical protein